MVFEYQVLVFLAVVLCIGFIYNSLWRRAKENKRQYNLNRIEYVIKQDMGRIISDRYNVNPVYLDCISFQEDDYQALAMIIETNNSRVLYESTLIKEDGTVIIRKYVRDDKTIVNKH